jgi:Phycobilisome protein
VLLASGPILKEWLSVNKIPDIVNIAETENRYLRTEEFEALKRFAEAAELRTRVASDIADNATSIVRQSLERLFKERPYLIAVPGGNAYGKERTAACFRDQDYFLRYITYAILAGDTSILDEHLLEGLKEMYRSLDVPINAVASGINQMKTVLEQFLNSEQLEVALPYFDYLVNALTSESNVMQQRKRSPLEILQQTGFIGCGSAGPDLSSNYKAILQAELQTKYDHH